MQIPVITAESWAETGRNLHSNPLLPLHKRICGEFLSMGLADGSVDETSVQAAISAPDAHSFLPGLVGEAIRGRLGTVRPGSSGEKGPSCRFSINPSVSIPGYTEGTVAGIEYPGGFQHCVDVRLSALETHNPHLADDAVLILAILRVFFPGMKTGNEAASMCGEMNEVVDEWRATLRNRGEAVNETNLDAMRKEWATILHDFYGEEAHEDLFEQHKVLALSAEGALDSPLYRTLESAQTKEGVEALITAFRERPDSAFSPLAERAVTLWNERQAASDMERAVREACSIHYDLPLLFGSGLLLMDCDLPGHVTQVQLEAAEDIYQMHMEAGEDSDVALIPLLPQAWGAGLDFLRGLVQAEALMAELADALYDHRRPR